ncbi:SDR family NAD(P)-dependent oxidoreductase [Sandarakinorhabdus sp.]|uniref:SDR family NAD(P)-dependent oxidoreductase n=1 Tax=Sandarakinorhabdus sp. TaxID=1916663 RepID=UPI003917B8C2
MALVTGAARGIGAAIVSRFLSEGAQVMASDVLPVSPHQRSAQLDVATLDVTKSGHWAEAIAQTERRFGRLDCLVNNAGIIRFSRFDDLDETMMRQIIDVNLIGTMLGCQAAIPALERAGGGTIINMSSADGLSGANSLTAYCASKFGVRGFTKALAMELGPRRIRVNSIHPGGILTEMANPGGIPRDLYDRGYWIYPAQRSGDPADVAAAAAYLASDDAAYCIGTELSVDGGLNAGHYYMTMPGAPKNPNA